MACYARPVSLYSDRHGIFRVNQKEAKSGDGHTQFSRALETLDIESIQALTPQAKGRVERVNKTLQDRLVKEMRLKGIKNLDEANAFLPEFISDFNQRFEKQAKNKEERTMTEEKEAEKKAKAEAKAKPKVWTPPPDPLIRVTVTNKDLLGGEDENVPWSFVFRRPAVEDPEAHRQ